MEKLENDDIIVVKSESEQEKPKKNRQKRHCSIAGCGKRDNGSMHRFPRDIGLRKQWIKACQYNKPITNYASVCNDHFLPSDFIPRWDRQLKRLKSIAVPSQNLPTKKPTKKLSPAQLKKAEERAERAAKRLEREDPRYEKLMEMKGKLEDENFEQVSIQGDNCELDMEPQEYGIQDVASSETENIKQNIVNISKSNNVVKFKRKKQILEKSDLNSVKLHPDHDYSNIVCKCNKNESEDADLPGSPEIRAAKVLVELNEKTFDMIKNGEINFTVKDVILKLGEEFYFATRKYYKTSITTFLKNDHQLFYFTGINTSTLRDLEKAMIVCEGDFSDKHELKLSDRIVLCFIKLRLNFSFSALGSLFHLNEQSCKKVFYSTIQTLKVILRSAIYWPTKDEILKCMPECFENFKKTITVLDRTEIIIEKSICSECRLPHVLINDNCEHLKILLGFAKSGLITYVSRAIHGRTSDETITDEAYISKVLIPSRDAIMTDGFFMEEECNRVFIECIRNRREKPFCPEAALKIQPKNVFETYMENAFRRFKMFKIFHTAIPFDMVPYVDDISVVICGVINLSNQMVAGKNFV